MQKTILIASDHRGFALKEKLKVYLTKKFFLKVKDLGTYCQDPCDYPLLAYQLAKEISKGKYRGGILICNSGIGHSIVANKVPGVRAALCYNTKAARFSREHNDSNILVIGSGFVNEIQAKRIIGTWLKTQFLGGRHKRRLDQITKIEREIMGEGK